MLYADGIHDDTLAIQALLDSGAAHVHLPAGKGAYLISQPLRVHSRQQLTLDRYATVRLADGSNCFMLCNADEANGDRDIEITGGIWDMNNMGQAKNPIHFPNPDFPNYAGLAVHFKNVKNLRLADLTIKDPVTFSITLNIVESFTVENITFDFNYGNPWAVNMDGVHLDGHCRMGVIRNIKGACYDDMVALNADEGVPGPITDIEIDGLFADDCHSAVRLLSRQFPVERIHIKNVYGTYYQYCIGLTKYYDGPVAGFYDGIVLEKIFAAKAPRYSVYRKDGSFVYPYIWVEKGLTVKNLHIEDVYRKEENVAIETLGIDPEAHIERLSFQQITQENHTGQPIPVIRNQGRIDKAHFSWIRTGGDEFITGPGSVGDVVREGVTKD